MYYTLSIMLSSSALFISILQFTALLWLPVYTIQILYICGCIIHNEVLSC